MIAFEIVVGEEPIPADWVEVEYTTDPLQKWRLYRRQTFNESRRVHKKVTPFASNNAEELSRCPACGGKWFAAGGCLSCGNTVLTRDVERSRRKRAVRAKTMSFGHRGYKKALVRERELYPEAEQVHSSRPSTRGECVGGPRPCPFVGCRYHLAIEAMPNGSIKHNFPDLEVWEMPDTCALDVADRGGVTLEQVGDLLNLTRERCRQIEDEAIYHVRHSVEILRLRELLDPGVPGKVTADDEPSTPDDDGDDFDCGYSYHFPVPAASVSLDDSMSPFERGELQVVGR